MNLIELYKTKNTNGRGAILVAGDEVIGPDWVFGCAVPLHLHHECGRFDSIQQPAGKHE
jgi:hypothetical protein